MAGADLDAPGAELRLGRCLGAVGYAVVPSDLPTERLTLDAPDATSLERLAALYAQMHVAALEASAAFPHLRTRNVVAEIERLTD